MLRFGAKCNLGYNFGLEAPFANYRGKGPDAMSAEIELGYEVKPRKTVIILCHTKQRCADLTTIAKACECHIVENDWQFGPESSIEIDPPTDYMLTELLSISEKPEQSLSEIARYLQGNRTQVLLWTDRDLLETAYAMLPPDRSHFLVDAHDGDAMPILSGAIQRMAMDQLHDHGHKEEYRALHRISDELAQFARTLAQMAESDKAGSQLADKPVSFRPAPSDAFRRLVTGGSEAEAEITGPLIRQMIKLRRLRDNFFDPSLFADPAWDILLDLMAARLENQQVSVSSLCIAAAVPATTALRWITTMTENGLLVRHHDPEDARRVFIALSEETASKLRHYLVEMQKRSASPV